MPEIGLQTALEMIVQSHDSGRRHCFVVGSGLSAPIVPGARTIIDECGRRAPVSDETTIPSDPMEQYSFWMRRAFPSPALRGEYLAELIRGKPISAANLRLAHLVTGSDFGRIVITPNFDDFFTRAVALFGGQPIVCDHPFTTGRVSMALSSTEIQVVHVHGTHWFYDACNLDHEIVARGTWDAQTPTMLDLLQNIFRERAPLVIGYSGWESDVVMKALRHQLSVRGFPDNCYWFCHNRDDRARLPDWLTSDPNVYLVLPDREVSKSSRTDSSLPPAAAATAPAALVDGSGGESVDEDESASSVLDDVDSGAKPTLSAQAVLDGLLQSLSVPIPRLLDDPIAALADRLANELAPSESPIDDLYRISSVVEKIRSAAACYDQPGGDSDPLEPIRASLRSLDYSGVIQSISNLERNDLTQEQKREIVEIALAASRAISGPSESELPGYDLVVSYGDEIAKDDPTVQDRVATAIYLKGLALSLLDRDDEALQTLDDFLERYSTVPAQARSTAVAMNVKAGIVQSLGEPEEALRIVDDIVERFGGTSDPGVLAHVAHAMSARARYLGSNQLDQALEAFAALDERFGSSEETEIRIEVARALVAKAYLLSSSGQLESAIEVCDRVIADFSQDRDEKLRAAVATAGYRKGASLGGLSRNEEAVAAYEWVITHFGEDTNEEIVESVAAALFGKAYRLSRLKKSEAAVETYDELVDRYGETSDETILVIVSKALGNKGSQLQKLGDEEAALDSYGLVVERFLNSAHSNLRSHAAKISNRRAALLNKMGRPLEAATQYSLVANLDEDRSPRTMKAEIAKARLELEEIDSADEE